MTAGNPRFKVTLETMVPDLLAQHPQAREVLDQYGLKGCGGPMGPHETLRFFARAHGVGEAELMTKLQQVIAPGIQRRMTSETPDPIDSIYRRFFVAGIVVVLTAGATWGAYLLWKIGFAKSFTSVSVLEVNAHGHAQIFGWVGLFIMGFALQAFPRMWHTRLVAPPLAGLSFVVMLAGIVIRTTGMAANGYSWAVPTAMVGGTLQLLAVLTFVTQLGLTFRQSKARLEPYIGFIALGMFWFAAQTVMSIWHTWTTMTATSREELLWYVSTYQAPLRDLQVHGLALFMIIGVSIRMLPALLGLPETSDRRGWVALVLLTVAVVSECLIFLAYRWTQNHVYAGMLLIPWILLAAGVCIVALPWKLWRPFSDEEARRDRIGKFIRAAYGWLAISLTMLLLFPVYLYFWSRGTEFSHAYHGAIRHAITVGFVSLMIMGIAAKVVPTLNGVDPRRLTALWGPFILVNLGCFLRVTTQTLTDWNPFFFRVVGISGVLEVTGLAWWGAGLLQILWRGRQELAAAAGKKPDSIVGHHRVSDVLEWFPSTIDVFLKHGFTPLTNPLLRATLARGVTLATATSLHRVPLDQLLADLNAAIRDLGNNGSNGPTTSDGCETSHEDAQPADAGSKIKLPILPGH